MSTATVSWAASLGGRVLGRVPPGFADSFRVVPERPLPSTNAGVARRHRHVLGEAALTRGAAPPLPFASLRSGGSRVPVERRALPCRHIPANPSRLPAKA
jgi:hypothetical protein